jgi:hypothetical protein
VLQRSLFSVLSVFSQCRPLTCAEVRGEAAFDEDGLLDWTTCHYRGLYLSELELLQTHMTQKPVLRVEVGARALRNPVGRGGGCGTCFCVRQKDPESQQPPDGKAQRACTVVAPSIVYLVKSNQSKSYFTGNMKAARSVNTGACPEGAGCGYARGDPHIAQGLICCIIYLPLATLLFPCTPVEFSR